MMNPKVKEQWLKDLRSGEFLQGMTALVRTGKLGTVRYCCLGVLSHRCPDVEHNGNAFYPKDKPIEFWMFSGMPNQQILDWSGLPTNQSEKLAEKNDTGATFEEIADYIEREL